MSLLDKASLIVTPNAYKESKLYSVVPSSGAGDMDVVRATTATRVNSAGLIESVAVNVPRIDYTNGSCPSLLVEPQRTNLIAYSEQLDNASWGKYNATITANNAISPNGTLTADKLVEDSATASHFIYSNDISVTAGSYYSFSFFAKKIDIDYISVTAGNYGQLQINSTFNINNGTVVASSGTAKITQIGDYYLCQVSGLSNTTRLQGMAIYLNRNNVAPPFSYTGNGTSGVHLWGAQLEAGSYPTSYIPTVASSVTRNADVISKTGISSLIGQTEGTLFADFTINNLLIPTNENRSILNVTNGTANFVGIIFSNINVLRAIIRANNGTIYTISTDVIPIGRYKLAVTYKNAELKLYVNGFLIGTNTSASISWSSALDRLNLDNSILGGESLTEKINFVANFKTVLTQTECINLTTL